MNDRQLLDQSLEELRARMERHQRLVRAALEGRLSDRSECLWSDCPHRQTLLELLARSVQVLDETRKAFKSKQLEALRKDFLRVLAMEVQAGVPAVKLPRG